MLDKRLVNVLAWTIFIAWVISMVLDAALTSYSPDPTLQGLIALLAGTAFGTTAFKKDKSDDDKDKKDTDA